MSKNSKLSRFSASKLQTYQNFQSDLVTLLNDVPVFTDYTAVGSSSGEELSDEEDVECSEDGEGGRGVTGFFNVIGCCGGSAGDDDELVNNCEFSGVLLFS